MTGLALRSLRRRASAFTATFLAVFLGAALLMSFGAMLDVAGDATGTARNTLLTVGLVVGGWGLLLVAFAVTSTQSLAVRQRAEEIALLRSAGATPGQVARMIIAECLLVAVAGGVLAIVPGWALGHGVLALMHDGAMVPETVGYAFGPCALGVGLGVTFASALTGGVFAARRAVRGTTVASGDEAGGLGRGRIIAAAVLLAAASGEAVTTATVMRGKGLDAMATSGQADIVAALALALLAPALVGGAARALAGPLRALGAVGDLVLAGLARRSRRLAAVVLPIILFTGIGIGTLHLQATENAASAGRAASADDRSVEVLNLVVIGMIILFAAIMLVNTLVAAVADRRREFGQQRLAGAAPGQVLAAVAVESAVLAALGIAAGTVASAFTSVPFAVARTGSALPAGGPLIFVGVAALAVVLTGGTAWLAARRALRAPAVAAVA
ncbi:FtsX-like permease family protein [Actinomadura rayongensis]|uniref:FtsX-like permease family protein n=1 Tax=Actinomadura rayongensis TaxID=1429076 RepID=A0A6I4W8G5_9ACTN|nr:FtsX-like permease family protein [Actinomadura rayongensis]